LTSTYLVNTDLVEHVLALDQFPRLLVGFEVAQADQTARTGDKANRLAAFNGLSNEGSGSATYPQ
jgi:hypothetical protein